MESNIIGQERHCRRACGCRHLSSDEQCCITKGWRLRKGLEQQNKMGSSKRDAQDSYTTKLGGGEGWRNVRTQPPSALEGGAANVGCAGMLSTSAAATCGCSTALVPGTQRCLQLAAAHERSRTAASRALYPSSTPGRRGALPRSHSTRWAQPKPENTTAHQERGEGAGQGGSRLDS